MLTTKIVADALRVSEALVSFSHATADRDIVFNVRTSTDEVLCILIEDEWMVFVNGKRVARIDVNQPGEPANDR